MFTTGLNVLLDFVHLKRFINFFIYTNFENICIVGLLTEKIRPISSNLAITYKIL